MSEKSSGTTSIATTSQPACSARAARAGPDRSSARRVDTDVETVRTAACTRGSLCGKRGGAGRVDERAHAFLVARAQQLDRIGLAVDDALEERLAVLVGGQVALGPAARIVEQLGQARVLGAVGGGDL